MKEIFLTGGEVTLVDDEDYTHLISISRKWYTKNRGYVVCVQNQETIYMHREIAKRKGLDVNNNVIRHKDTNLSNNQKNNIYAATRSETSLDRGVQKNSKLGLKYISYSENERKYKVRIRRKGITVFSGTFKSIEEAIEARDNFLKDFNK